MVYDSKKCALTKKMTVMALQESFNYWTAKHPTPDEKVIKFGGEVKYSPNQLNKQVQNNAGHGQVVLDWLTSAVSDQRETPSKAIYNLMCKKRGLQR